MCCHGPPDTRHDRSVVPRFWTNPNHMGNVGTQGFCLGLQLQPFSRLWFQIFYFHPYLGKIPILTNIFLLWQKWCRGDLSKKNMDWNVQRLVVRWFVSSWMCFLLWNPYMYKKKVVPPRNYAILVSMAGVPGAKELEDIFISRWWFECFFSKNLPRVMILIYIEGTYFTNYLWKSNHTSWRFSKYPGTFKWSSEMGRLQQWLWVAVKWIIISYIFVLFALLLLFWNCLARQI